MTALMQPGFRVGIALTRLDERITRSAWGESNACISPMLVSTSGSTANSLIWNTSSFKTPFATSAPQPTDSPSPATFYEPAGASLAKVLDWALSADGIRMLRMTSEITLANAEAVKVVAAIRRAVTTDPQGEGV